MSQLFPMRSLQDQRPLVLFWDKSFGSSTLEYGTAINLCEFYGFRPSVCDSFESLRQCLEVVKNLFTQQIRFSEVNSSCQSAVLKFLGLSEPKNLYSTSNIRKLEIAFSSFQSIMKMNFAESEVSSFLGKDVLRLFQATLGITILDIKVPKADHLGYLSHAQRVIRREVDVGEAGWHGMGDGVPIDVTNRIAGIDFPPGLVRGWALSLPDEDSDFYRTVSDGLLLFLALLAGCGDVGNDWTADSVLEFVRYVDCEGVGEVQRRYLSTTFLRRLSDNDILVLLTLFAYTADVEGLEHALTILVSIGASITVVLIREETTLVSSSSINIPPRSVLATAEKRGLPPNPTTVTPLCRSCPPVDPASEEGWIERQAARGDYRLWNVSTLREWLLTRMDPLQVGTSKHVLLAQISTWLSGKTADGLRRFSPSEPDEPYPSIEYHRTRQFSDDVRSRVFSISTLNKLSLYVMQAEMATLYPSFFCSSNDKEMFIKAMLEAYPVRAFGEAKLNSWSFLQRSKSPVFTKCSWPPLTSNNVLVALPFWDITNEGAEPLIAYYSLLQEYHGEEVVLLGIVNAMPTIPTTIFISIGEIVAICYSTTPALIVQEPIFVSPPDTIFGSPPIPGSTPIVRSSFPFLAAVSSPMFSFSTLDTATPAHVFPIREPRDSDQPIGSGGGIASTAVRNFAPVDATSMSGLTLVAREQPSRAKGDRTLKALMIADAFIRTVSVDPNRVLSTVMADVFLSLVTHTGILTQLALVEVTQILQSVNFPSYALAIPLTMSSRHDVTQALTTAKLFVGWRSEEPFPDARATRYDYRSNDPSLVNRVLWTIFRVRYGYFDFHVEIWEAMVKFALRCEKLVRDLFHWTQNAVDFMIKKALRDLEMVDDRVGLTVPSALIAPSPDAVQGCPILDKNAYRNAIDLLPDMQAPDAYFMHHQFVLQAQQLHFEGMAIRYVVPLTVVPLFSLGYVSKKGVSKVEVSTDNANTKGKFLAQGFSVSMQQTPEPISVSKISKKERMVSGKKRRQAEAFVAAGPTVAPASMSVPLLSVKRSSVLRNRPCYQWLSTIGCPTGTTCRFDHASPNTKGGWEFSNRRMGELGLIPGVQIGTCPAL